jgi:(4S)-4-hydroxy-5-phosphonooxypentane-2,3-dione isomerase
MFAIIVSLQVRPEMREEFLQAIRINSKASLRDEPGCLRFDVLSDTESPDHFVLYEIYQDEHAFRVEHRNASHYAEWRKAADRCLAEGGSNTYLVPALGSLAEPGLVAETRTAGE